MSASVAGGVIAFYQLGYGIAAFGAGPLQDAGVGLPTIFGFAAVAAVVMGGLSFVLAPPTTRGALHPCMNARRPFRTDRMMRADPWLGRCSDSFLGRCSLRPWQVSRGRNV
jgi:hypothetical protein